MELNFVCVVCNGFVCSYETLFSFFVGYQGFLSNKKIIKVKFHKFGLKIKDLLFDLNKFKDWLANLKKIKHLSIIEGNYLSLVKSGQDFRLSVG